MSIEENFFQKKGNFPVILSVPHGGTQLYDEIPLRKQGVLGIDKRTITLAKELINWIEHTSESIIKSKKTPSFIMARIPRKQIDFNRPISKAINGDNPLAREFYHYYHESLKEMIQENLKDFEASLLLDIHGFEKEKRPAGYRDVEVVFGTNNLKSLFSHEIAKRDRDKNIRGKLIKSLLELDLQIAPGYPRRKEYVLTGGYITRYYGASRLQNSQAIQIEFSDRLRITEKALRNSVLKQISKALIEYWIEKDIF